MRDVHFFPYNPRLMRAALFLCAVVCVALAAWAFSEATAPGIDGGGASTDLIAWARLGVAAGLAFAFAYMLFRTRPREGWGVALTPLVLEVSRPLQGEPLSLSWSQVSEVRREGRKKERLMVLLQPEGRVILSRHLFATSAQFEALAEALQARAPPRRYDA